MADNKFQQAFELVQAKKGSPADDIPGQLSLVREVLTQEALLPAKTVEDAIGHLSRALQGKLVERDIIGMRLDPDVQEFLRKRAAVMNKWYQLPEII